MRFINDGQRRAAFWNMRNKFSETVKKPVGISLADNSVPDWITTPVNKTTVVDTNKISDADYLLNYVDKNSVPVSGDSSTIGLNGAPVKLVVHSDKKKLKELDDIFNNMSKGVDKIDMKKVGDELVIDYNGSVVRFPFDENEYKLHHRFGKDIVTKLNDGYRLNEFDISYGLREDIVDEVDRKTKAKFSSSPNYDLETWQKEVAGVPKYKIDEYYRGIWDRVEPQLEGRNILVKHVYDGKDIVKRHPPGSEAYTTIKSKDNLSNLVREHAIEFWEETSKKGDLNRGDLAVLDIDNLDEVPERKIKDVTKAVYKDMGSSFGHKPYIINTQGGYHVGVKLDKPVPYKTLRKKMDKEVIEPVEAEFEGLASKRHGKTPIFLDKTPVKKHGSTKIVGSLNLPDLTITEKIPIEELDGFRRHKLR